MTMIPILSFLLLVQLSCAELISIPDQLNNFAWFLKPQLEILAKNELPATFGNCGDSKAPAPCSGNSDLYYKKASLYKAKARWITGLNNLDITKLNFTAASSNRALDIAITLRFADLPMSLRIEGCAWIAGCTKFWDNRSSCCGKNKELRAVIRLTCSSELPYFSAPVIRDIDMDTIKIEPKLFGKFKIKISDITTKAETAVKHAVEKLLTENLMDDLNGILDIALAHVDATCASQK